jgi:hypothetical protein
MQMSIRKLVLASLAPKDAIGKAVSSVVCPDLTDAHVDQVLELKIPVHRHPFGL